MNNDDIKSLENALNSLETSDVAKLLGETWPNQDLETTQVGGGVTAVALLSRIKRITAQTRNAIDDDPYAFPRYYHNPDNPRATTDLLNEIQSLWQHVQGRAWHEASTNCQRIIHCLVLAGHWSKTTKRAHAAYEKKAADLLSTAEAKLVELSTSLEAMRIEKDTLTKQIKESRSALGEITNALQAARNERQQLTDILTQSSKDQGKLTSDVETGAQNLRAVQTLTADNQALLKELNESLKAAKEFHTKAETDSAWIGSKRKEINDLVGKAADGSLGGTFRSRKEELDTSVKTWKSIAFLATVLAATYVPFAFLLIPSPQVSDGLVLLANLGKILPVVLFLGFVLRQYARERSFLEEYAFKTSVAFVVNAYADQLASQRFEKTLADFEDDREQWSAYLEKREAERKKLIKETVDRLFEPPQIHADKAPSLVAFRPKAAADILREAKELLAEARK